MYCPGCGRKLPDREASCPSCGTPAPTQEEKQAGENTPGVLERRHRRKLIGCMAALFVGLFILLLVVAIIGFGVGWKGTVHVEWVVSVLWCGSGIALASLLNDKNND